MSRIEGFIALRLREAKSSEQDRQQMASALKMIAEVHRNGDGYCDGCYRAWPCLTIRHVAWTWRDHSDYDRAWHWTIDDLFQGPLTDDEQTYLIKHGGVDPEIFTPVRMAELGREIEEELQVAKRLLPVRGPWGLREVIDTLPAMSHRELVQLLYAPQPELDDMSPVEWLADDGAASVVIEVLAGRCSRRRGRSATGASRELDQDRASGRL